MKSKKRRSLTASYRAYGYVAMGPYQGGQAQAIRVPYADFNCLTLPPGTEHEADFALLADIFPTGWHVSINVRTTDSKK